MRVFAFRDSDHPQELVDVVAGVADHGAEDDQDVGSAFRMRKGMKMRKISRILSFIFIFLVVMLGKVGVELRLWAR